MQRERLTLERIRRFTCPPDKQQAFLFDTDSPRLAIRATAGSKSFAFEAKLNRQTIRLTIGGVQDWGLDDAREEARRLQRLVDQGVDPRIDAAERLAETVAKQEAARRVEEPALTAWAAYCEARRSKWGERTYSDHLRVVAEPRKREARGRKKGQGEMTEPGALRTLLSQPLRGVAASQVQQWLTTEAERRPAHAGLCFRMLRAFLNWCSYRPEYADMVDSDACASRLVRDELPRKQAKDDCLQREQLTLWFAEVRKLPPVPAAYLQAALLTGARREEIAAIRWEDVDFKWGSLTIRDKVEGERTIPLTPYVAALFLDLKRQNDTPPPKHRILRGKRIENDLENWKPSPWVFFSRSESGHIAEPRAAHHRALAIAGLPSISIHGLRRSFGTLAEWCECPVGIVAQIMGHKPSATAEKHYRVRPLDLLRMWHTKIEGWMLEQAGIKQPKLASETNMSRAAA